MIPRPKVQGVVTRSAVLDPVLSPVLYISLIYIYTYIKNNILSTGVQDIFNIHMQIKSDALIPIQKSFGGFLYLPYLMVMCVIVIDKQQYSMCCTFDGGAQ
jgi:hypothetical protein